MTDFRVKVGFSNHPKTQKLRARLGHEGVACLIALWEFCAHSRPDGDLAGLDNEDIANACGYRGNGQLNDPLNGPLNFVPTLVALRWLDGSDGAYRIHDWAIENPFVATAEERRAQASEAGRASAEARRKKREALEKESKTKPVDSTERSTESNGALNGSLESVQPPPSLPPTNPPPLPGVWDPKTASAALTLEHLEAWGFSSYGGIRKDNIGKLRVMLPITREEFEDASRGAEWWTGLIGNLTAIRNPGAAPKPVRSFGQHTGPPRRSKLKNITDTIDEPKTEAGPA